MHRIYDIYDVADATFAITHRPGPILYKWPGSIWTGCLLEPLETWHMYSEYYEVMLEHRPDLIETVELLWFDLCSCKHVLARIPRPRLARGEKDWRVLCRLPLRHSAVSVESR